MRSVSEYRGINPSDKREANKSIFIWLDILGFADALEREERYGELSELLRKFQSLFNNENSYRTTIISDGIILQITDPQYEKFKEIINDIGKKQFQFICENKKFIRGGIAVGTKLENDKGMNNQFISNGLAIAVKTESNHVNWPIIGTNEKNMSDIREIFNVDGEEENFDLLRGFNKNGEDLYFIDFIEKNESYLELIISKITKNEGNPGIRNKYIWLLRYYLHKYKDREKVNIPPSLKKVVL